MNLNISFSLQKRHKIYGKFPKWKYLPFILLSKLPMGVLRGIGFFAYLIVYKTIAYRLGVVRKNIAQAFPDLNKSQRVEVEKKFYKMFFQNFAETIKVLSREKNWFNITYIKNETYYEFFEKQEKKFLLTGHITNFELISSSATFETNLAVKPVYKEQQSEYFDRLIHYIRSSFGAKMIEMDKLLKDVTQNAENSIYYMFGDQSTGMHPGVLWIEFLNKKTPFYTGTEKICNKYKLPIYYGKYMPGNTQGAYICEIIKLNPTNVTEQYVRLLEQNIREFPHIYLWTHKRWKHDIEDYKKRFATVLEA